MDLKYNKNYHINNTFTGPIIMIRNSIIIALSLILIIPVLGQRQMENLTRGIVAVKKTSSVYIGWRLFGTDPETIAFNLYRITDNAEPVKVNKKPITGATNYTDHIDDPNKELQYFVQPILNGKADACME